MYLILFLIGTLVGIVLSMIFAVLLSLFNIDDCESPTIDNGK